MSSEQPSTPTREASPSRGRGRGRGKSRGGLGKYLRARGRGRGGGRPAEFHKRLVLEDEEVVELEPDSEEAKELARKYAKRRLQSNADRYAEPEPVLNSEGEEEVEPEVDLSSFLARQRLDDAEPPSLLVNKEAEDDSDVDRSLSHLLPKSSATPQSRKGKFHAVEWNEELEEMRREKEIADANRELKDRFKANAERQKNRQARGDPKAETASSKKGKSSDIVEAPPLPSEESAPKSEKEEMEEFLDDLLG